MNDALFRSARGMEYASNYNRWLYDLFSEYVRGDILEIGCGVGAITERIVENGSYNSLVAIDLSADAIQYCNSKFKNSSCHFSCQDMMQMSGSFDLVICMNVLEHIEDDRSALRKMLTMINDGGVLFLLVPAHKKLYSSFDRLGGHYRRYSKEGIRDLLETASIDSLRLEQFYFNLIGALGYLLTYKALQKQPDADAHKEINFYDKAIVPFQRRMEGKWIPFGLSLVSIIKKEIRI